MDFCAEEKLSFVDKKKMKEKKGRKKTQKAPQGGKGHTKSKEPPFLFCCLCSSSSKKKGMKQKSPFFLSRCSTKKDREGVSVERQKRQKKLGFTPSRISSIEQRRLCRKKTTRARVWVAVGSRARLARRERTSSVVSRREVVALFFWTKAERERKGRKETI